MLEVAENSKCVKRRVGAVLVDKDDNIIAAGWNHHPLHEPCEDENGDTKPEVIHAEIDAINQVLDFAAQQPSKMYLTHEPCLNCRGLLQMHGIEFEVIKDCVKFDTGKLRYDLVPTEAYKGIAEVMTFGARKYKPNNWRNVDDIARFMAAHERHYMQFKEFMEKGDEQLLYDEETHLHVLKHGITNLTFILELTKTLEYALDQRERSESIHKSDLTLERS